MLDIPKIEVGTSLVVQKRITEEDTSKNYGSETLDKLLSTPALATLMIGAAAKAVDDKLPEGIITVGKQLEIIHDKPTGLGVTVSVKVEVKESDGQKLFFDIIAYDEIGVIARGSHERVIVNRNALLERSRKRAKQAMNIVE